MSWGRKVEANEKRGGRRAGKMKSILDEGGCQLLFCLLTSIPAHL